MILSYEWSYSRVVFPNKAIKALEFNGPLTTFILRNNK